ncbi:XdhC family protein [Parachitinimonas caeni]|uniref:XdhC family protein n=1 Tax=Parachitinimonas caeni TaxID=3031301 RepID=A0ABT7E108_9NEIS|nr:XdhC family protein [Parachitinimonas caeni]MDK2125971.1 XdhC family protein [Parachitinimonas caeni]
MIEKTSSILPWLQSHHAVTLVTVIETWGSAPRPVGSLMAVRDDGLVEGSVSGGCVEDDLVRRVLRGEWPAQPQLVTYGVSRDEAARFGLPCGGTLRLLVEPLRDAGWIAELQARIARHELVARRLDLATGAVELVPSFRGDRLQFDGQTLHAPFGPQWRLLLIGGGQLSQVMAQMAPLLGYQVLVCDPRRQYRSGWEGLDVVWQEGMPDDVVVAIQPDAHTAIVALTHDPKLDDMALLEALKSPAFYVGALGSKANSQKRRERLALFDLGEAEIARLHGPVGLSIGSRTPGEIAVSILAEMTAVKNAIRPLAQPDSVGCHAGR